MENLNDVYKSFSDDDLAAMILSLKEQATDIRTAIWRAEDELRNRLITNNAKRLQGQKYLIKSTVDREIKWDHDAIVAAGAIAQTEGRADLFRKAFPTVFAPKIRELNELLKFGGKTAEAIEAAKLEVKEKVKLDFEEVRGGA